MDSTNNTNIILHKHSLFYNLPKNLETKQFILYSLTLYLLCVLTAVQRKVKILPRITTKKSKCADKAKHMKCTWQTNVTLSCRIKTLPQRRVLCTTLI